MSSKTRIIWNAEERRSFAENVVKLEKSHPELTAVEILNAAQANFPVARRRTGLTTFLSIPWMQAERIRILTKQPEVQVQSVEPAASEAELSGLEHLINHLLDRLPGLLLDRLTERLLAGKQVSAPAVEVIPAPVVKPMAQPTLESKPERLTKILVIGMLDRQAKDLKNEVGALLDVRTWDNGGVKKLRALVDSSERVFIMADKTSHSVIKAAVAAASGKKSRIKEIHGGETAMTEAIIKYAIEEV